MRLILKLVSPDSEACASAPEFVVGNEASVLIGRLSENDGRHQSCDWVINEKHVSRNHARIRFVNGLFYVEALGQNRTSVDDPSHQLPIGQPQPLKHGCRLFIDTHEISVSEVDDWNLKPGPRRGDKKSVSPDKTKKDSVSPPVPKLDDRKNQGNEASLDDTINKFIYDPEPAPPIPMPSPTPAPPAPKPSPGPGEHGISQNALNLLIGKSQKLQNIPIPVHGQNAEPNPEAGTAGIGPRTDETGKLADLFRGAGIDPAELDLTPEVAHQLGEILRIVVEGTMQVLHARAEIKDQFRMRGTRVQYKDNNPLKFSADLDDALHNLLVKRNDAYLPPVEAFQSAFDEIRSHQIAMFDSLRVAFDDMMHRLDPQKIASDVDKRAKSALIIGIARARYWDAYENMMKDYAKVPEDRFRRFFGDSFGKAYEKHLTARVSGRRKPVGEREC